MAAQRNVIVGAGTAGWNAITAIREIDKGASEIILVSDEAPYSRMVLPYYLAGQIGESHCTTAGPHRLAALKVQARIGARAAKVDAKAGKLILANGDEIPYDNLLIATGSSAVRPPIPGAEGANVHSFWTLLHARGVAEGIKPGSRVAMIGAGFIAFTILNALVSRGARLTVLEIAPRILPRMVDEAAARIVQAWLEERGVTVRPGVQVTAIEDAGKAKRIKLKDGGDVEADLVIMATGIRPNLEWLKGSGVEVKAGVVVDERLRSSVPNVYAAGDVAEGPVIGGGRAVHAIEPTAMQHGRVAGANMAGREVAYPGSLLMNIVDVMDLEIASFGAWDDAGAEACEDLRPDRPAYRKLLFRGGRLAGAIVLGRTREIWATNDVGMLKGLVYTGRDLSAWKARLKARPQDVRLAFLSTGTTKELLPQTLLGRPSVPEREVRVNA
ncbi:MAG: NAD(P)/FAD-dependent oxidoreductase [Candidatus Tectomicrobia bacterium]|uniref:NAD(P)/FAD-dependent oxidoreductase n=1 Tax=Tectimicrobiota bacterium TaxID=2528274 RepID=A0A932I0V4_UNCTE|nr:NAD(P)/FAD-dependent oxidoreductase [Candidatus Tectomicrobia bacterium]